MQCRSLWGFSSGLCMYDPSSHWSPPPDQQGLQNGASLKEQERWYLPALTLLHPGGQYRRMSAGCLSGNSVLYP